MIKQLSAKLSVPVDNSPLIIFRIIFGLLITAEAWGAIMTGWVRRAFIEPDYFFPFIDFSWLHPLPGNGMYYYFIVMGIFGVMVMLGWYYRFAIISFTVMWTAVYLMQKTHYNNHYYLLVLLSALMAIVPAHQYKSLDVVRKPEIRSSTCPQWSLWIFVAQISIVYVYASVAKMYPDWIAAKPVGIWFEAKKNYFLIGPLLEQRWFQYAVSYGGILFDLLIAPGLLWKRTRKVAFGFSVFFHLFNSAVFQVGIFPYMAIALGVFFFEPHVIRKFFFKRKTTSEITTNYAVKPLLIYVFVLYFIGQALLPLRHWMYSGSPLWTEEGHRLSWRMMLRVKSGYVRFRVIDPKTNKEWNINPREYVTSKQATQIAAKPDFCWQFVQLLKEDFTKKGHPDVEIYAAGEVNLNRNSSRPLYNPEVNLSKVKWSKFGHANWLLPFQQSL